jgi:hypothetical protein
MILEGTCVTSNKEMELRLRQSLEHAQNRATEVEIRTFWIFVNIVRVGPGRST